MPNGLVVDLLPTSQSGHPEDGEMQTQHIFNMNEQSHQTSMVDRQYLNDISSVEESLVASMPKQLDQNVQRQKSSQHIFIQSNAMNDEAEENENGNIDEGVGLGNSDRPVSEQFYQYFSKEDAPMIMNETHVIVSNKVGNRTER